MLKQFGLIFILFLVMDKYCGRTVRIFFKEVSKIQVSNFQRHLSEILSPMAGEEFAFPPQVRTALEGLRELNVTHYRIHESFLDDEIHPKNEHYQRMVDGAWPIEIMEVDPPYEIKPDKDFYSFYHPDVAPILTPSIVIFKNGFLKEYPKCRQVWQKGGVELGYCDI